MSNLFVLDHYYAIDHEEYCLVVESEKTVDEVIQICSSIAFLLEDIFDPSVCLDMDCLRKVLVAYYGMVDQKENFKDVLQLLDLPIEGRCEKVKILDFYHSDIFVVDLYEARESCCGDKYREIMDKWLPKGTQLQELKELLKREGVEQ